MGRFVLRHLIYAPLVFLWWFLYFRLTSDRWHTPSEMVRALPAFLALYLILLTIFALVRLVGQKLRGSPVSPSRPS